MLKSKIFRRILMVLWALFVMGVLGIITFLVLDNIILPAYVGKYKVTEVPYVIGFTVEEALDSLRSRHLIPEVYGTGKYVVRTEPEAGMPVKEHRIIRVYLADSLSEGGL